MKILIIDDEKKLADIVRRSLMENGYLADIALDGTSGLQLAYEVQYDLIILDINLPDMEGFEVLQRIRQNDAVMVMMLTARSSLEDRVRGLEQGADDYLPKPATAPMILRTLGLVKPESVAIETTMTPLHRLEWEHIHQALHETGGNVSAAARLLGMHRRSLQRKLAKKPGPEREVLVD